MEVGGGQMSGGENSKRAGSMGEQKRKEKEIGRGQREGKIKFHGYRS